MADGLCLVNNTDSSNTSAKKTETASNQMDNSIVKLNEKLLNEQKSVCVTIVDCFGAMKNSVETQKCEQKMSEKNQLLLSCGSSGSGVVTNTTTTTTTNNNITANATVVDNNDDKNNQQNSDVVNSENESMIKTAAAVTSLNNVNNKNNVKSNKNSAVHCVEKPIIKPSNLDGLLIKPIGLHKLTDLKPPQSQKDIDDKRKKRRCQDRYDSSESSDSGVATLSCTDSSTASSDVSDPGSPYSPLSCDDNNQLSSGVSVGSMPPLQQQHQHQQQRTASSTAAAIPSSQNNWSWSTNFVGLNVGGNSNNNNNINLINNNNNCNTKIKRNSAPEQQTSTLKTTPIVSIKRCRTLSLDKTFIAAPPPTKPITQSKPTVDNVTPQTKITGFFKSQIKPVNGLKRDLSNLVSSSDLSAKQIKKNCDIDVRTLTTMPPLIKKVERKSAKIAPLAPITRKNLSKKQQQQQQQILSPPKKPVTIAPRASAANNNSIAKRLNPPPLIPKLPDSHPQQQLQKSPLDQQSPKLTSPTVLLTTIRLPHHQQQHQQQIIQHNQPKIAPAKMGSIFQLHAAPIPMPKLVQIPNILSKDQTTNLLMNNNGQLTRINNGGSHYFLNGAVIKLQQLSSQQTNGQQQPQTNVDMLQMKSSQQSIGDTVPFTSKSLPPPLQQQQQQSQVQNNAHFVSANATNAHQYAQPVFMATSSGLLLSTALPTVITSQISGLQQQQQHQQINQQHSAIPALHPFNQPTSNILPSINTILQNHHHNHSTSYVTSQQQNNCYQLHTTTETSHHQLLQQQHQQHFSQTITQQRMIANIPQPLVSINTNLPSKIPHPSYATSCQSPAQIFIATTMPALITTSTPTTSSITSLCMSPKESTLPQQKLPPPLLKFDEMPELTKFKLKIETALPTMPVLVPQQPPNQVKPQSLTNNSQCPTTNASELMDLCSPAVPLLSPKVEKTLLPPQCLASPKSLVLEKIQQKISDNLDDSGIAITPKKQSLPINDVLLLKTPKIETEFQTASLPECAKSPILSQPKTIRFPAMNNGNGPICGGIRKSDGRVIGACYWDDCNVRYDTSSKLLDHLQTQHVNSQSGPFTCQWSGCKVHGRESCSRRWLERHVLSHGGTKQFKCIVDGCGLRFGSQLALQKHVNGHFTTTETKDPAARRSSDPPVPKKLRVNGKKLRYRRQPFSARMFDYFDNGIMEALQHRLAHTMATASGPGGSVSFTGQLQGRRTTNEGRVEFLIKWNPSDILPDEWMAESLARESLVKAVNIQTMSSEQRYLLHKYIKKSYKKNNSTNAANAAGDEDCSNFTNGPISESFSSSSLSSTSSSFASSPIVTPTTKRHRKQPKKMPS